MKEVEATKAELKAEKENEDQSNVTYSQSDERVGKQQYLMSPGLGYLQPKALPMYPGHEVTNVKLAQRNAKFHEHSALDVKVWDNELELTEDQQSQNEDSKSKLNADVNTFIAKQGPKYSCTNVHSTL